MERAFRECKKILTENILRAQPKFERRFILTSDTSEKATGAISAQKQNGGTEKVIYAFSKTLDSTQRNHSVTDKELLAIVKSVEYFRWYLLGKEFKLKTDHKALEYLKSAKEASSRMLRWGLKLQEYEFTGERCGPYGLSRYCERINYHQHLI